jgi:hypothetical protein
VEAVRAYLREYALGKTDPFVFLSHKDRDLMSAWTGSILTPTRVLELRRSLARFHKAFNVVREKPDWNIGVEGGEPPPLPMLMFLRHGHDFMPPYQSPTLSDTITVPAFSAPEVELIRQAQAYWNSEAAKKAFPKDRYPNMFKQTALQPPLPTQLWDYKQEIELALATERQYVLPGDMPPPDALREFNEVLARLVNFLNATEQLRD